MPPSRSTRPLGVIVAVVATMGLAVFTVTMAVLSLSSGHGMFSTGVALALVLWALLVGASGVLLWRGARWVRGAVVGAGLLHVFAYGQFAIDGSPLALVGAAAGLVAVIGTLLPASTEWLRVG